MSEATDRVLVREEDQIAFVSLNRADKRNALDPDMFKGILAVIENLKSRADIRAVVLYGEGPSFCSGLDFPAFMAAMGSQDGVDPFQKFDDSPANFVQRMGYGWKELPMPVIAAIEGHCYGGGLQIALGADIRIAASDAKLSVMEIKWGLIPDMSITATIRDVVRLDVAKELTYTGRVVKGDEAQYLGLVTEISDSPLERATELARTIASKNPHAIRHNKRLLEQAWHGETAQNLALEEELQRTLLGSPNQMEAVAANFQKRNPEFADVE